MNNLHTTSILSLLVKTIHRKGMIVLDRAQKAIFGHSSNCGTECRSDGTSVE